MDKMQDFDFNVEELVEFRFLNGLVQVVLVDNEDGTFDCFINTVPPTSVRVDKLCIRKKCPNAEDGRKEWLRAFLQMHGWVESLCREAANGRGLGIYFEVSCYGIEIDDLMKEAKSL